jgi:5'-nucleotidase/UDP-sugar diphosphatase
MNRRIPAVCGSLALLACAACATATRPIPSTAPLQFLLVNDVYIGDTLRDGTAGLARTASLRQSLAKRGPLLFVLAGDVLSPSMLSKWYHGAQIVDEFNSAHLDYSTFGNHEFELDRDTLVKRIAESRFKWTSANCMESKGDPFPLVSRWDTTTVGGVRVGIFGLTLIGDYRRYVTCSNPDSAAHRAVGELKNAGAQLIVGLTHQSLASDSILLEREPSLDLILGGHEHEWHALTIGGRKLVKADANARTAQYVTIRRDGDRWLQSDRLIPMDRSLSFDPATAAVVKAWRDSLVKRVGPERIVATIDQPMDARDAISRNGESGLGDLVTDAIRLGTGADVAMINSGTMRLDDVIPPGKITNYQMESIFLFADESHVVTFPITGARLRELLEHGVARTSVGRGAYVQVSGVKFRWDPSRPDGSRIVGDLLRPDGRVIRPDETITLAFDVYPACEKGDGYVVPEAQPACARQSQAPRAVDLLMRHIETNLGGRITSPTGGRVTRM